MDRPNSMKWRHTANGTRLSNSDLEREVCLRGVAPFLATSSDRDDPWLCGYLEDMLYAFAASNCNLSSNAADLYTVCV